MSVQYKFNLIFIIILIFLYITFSFTLHKVFNDHQTVQRFLTNKKDNAIYQSTFIATNLARRVSVEYILKHLQLDSKQLKMNYKSLQSNV